MYPFILYYNSRALGLKPQIWKPFSGKGTQTQKAQLWVIDFYQRNPWTCPGK